MNAYRFNNAETGLQLEHIDVPQASPGEVLIAVKAAGLCHSDCHILKGNDWIGKRPITLGHEVAGTIVALGDGVSNFRVGDRVAVALIAHPVEQMQLFAAIGLGFDGGFAEYVTAPVTHIVSIPDNVSYEQAAIATDLISTAYHAILAEANVTASTTVVVVGLGGLGLNGLQIAVLQGARVYGIDIDPKKCAAAKKLGAIECFASLDSMKEMTIDVIVDFFGSSATLSKAITTVKVGGRIVAVGLGEPETTLPLVSLVSRAIELKGSIGASLEDLHSCLALIASGDICPVLEYLPFTDLIEGYHRLERGEVNGRLFTRPGLSEKNTLTPA
ncbi:Polyketide synthase, enoylreductase [Penicillium griseofulvum]|uniref:Polyketide synthase, enoylreductase n=1 Tax=Penicillium patulum TaxID=5078 RepID=A0A135LA77_PENPA|nr:Polyketide synthase, enoylreductase [Penicillium griseofulvum]KXG45853.1 Polyketide synthase, enoylreductase [Penicillium griseofulvum]